MSVILVHQKQKVLSYNQMVRKYQNKFMTMGYIDVFISANVISV